MAIDFAALRFNSVLGRAARLPLRLIPGGATMRVLQGPLKGAKWIAGSHTHGCWLGSYELDKQRLFAEHVRQGDAVWDIGANVGFYTLLASRLVGPTGRVIAFEPSPRNLHYLREHVARNRLPNVTVFDAAVGERPGRVAFDESPGPAMGKVGAGSITVPLVSVDDLVATGKAPPPTLLKVDVEGAEAMVLRGALDALRTSPRPKVFLATHGPSVHKECTDILRSAGYALLPLSGPDVENADELLAA